MPGRAGREAPCRENGILEEIRRAKDIFRYEYRQKEENESGLRVFVRAARGTSAQSVPGGGRHGGTQRGGIRVQGHGVDDRGMRGGFRPDGCAALL